jgi:hypothetical protein
MWERVLVGVGEQRKQKPSAVAHVIIVSFITRIGCTLLTCNMYMCDLRHIHDPVLSSLKMEGIRLLFISRDCLTTEDGNDMMSCRVGNQLRSCVTSPKSLICPVACPSLHTELAPPTEQNVTFLQHSDTCGHYSN